MCKVQVEAGEYRKHVMSRAYISAEEEAASIVLACRVKPRSDIRLAVLGKMRERVRDADSGGRGRKAAVEQAGATRRMNRGARAAERTAENPVRDP